MRGANGPKVGAGFRGELQGDSHESSTQAFPGGTLDLETIRSDQKRIRKKAELMGTDEDLG